MSWLKKKTVLVPVDFSELSHQALIPAKEFVEDLSSLHLIHVLSPLHPADPAAMWNSPSSDERQKKVKEFLSEKVKALGFENLPIKVAIGDTTGEIMDYATAINADLIVMPSHGFTGAKRLFSGSIAEHVVRLSPCPVLVLK